MGPRLACHDKWRYDDKNRIAKLIGFEIHCSLCDLATHIGKAEAIGYRQEATQQLCNVNRCTEKDAEQIAAAAMSLWGKRSKKKWTVVVAPALLKRYPRLEAVTALLLHKASGAPEACYALFADHEPPWIGRPQFLRVKNFTT